MTTDFELKRHASRLADLVENFLWYHSGGDDARMLPGICKASVEALDAFQKAYPKRVPLKYLIQMAYEQARIEGTDPWEAILVAISHRTKDWEEFSSDDRPLYEDISAWLRHEAAFEHYDLTPEEQVDAEA